MTTGTEKIQFVDPFEVPRAVPGKSVLGALLAKLEYGGGLVILAFVENLLHLVTLLASRKFQLERPSYLSQHFPHCSC